MHEISDDGCCAAKINQSINQSITNFTTSKTVWTRKLCHKYQLGYVR